MAFSGLSVLWKTLVVGVVTFGIWVGYLSSIHRCCKMKVVYGFYSLSLKTLSHLYRRSLLFHFLSRIFADRKPPLETYKELKNMKTFERLSPRTTRVLGLNPGSYTLSGTNTYLVGCGKEKILIDTGEDMFADKYVKFLFEEVMPSTDTERISSILLTHGHIDHQGGIPRILQECVNRKLFPLPKIYKKVCMDDKYPVRSVAVNNVSDRQVFEVEGARIHAIDTPGHTSDHVCYLIEEDRAICCGDCVLGCGTSVFDDLYQYMMSLRRLRSFGDNSQENGDKNESKVLYLYPGHGPAIMEGYISKIDEYIDHRNQREIAILKYLEQPLEGGKRVRKISSWELIEHIYGNIKFIIKISAHWNLLHHLEKLEKEGRIERSFPDLWSLKRK